MPVWLTVSRRAGKRATYLAAVACYLPVLLSWLFAAAGEANSLFLARGFLTGMATGGLTLAAQAMLPDTIEHDFARTGLRREAMFSAVYSMAEKLASATGGDNYIETVWGRGYVLREPTEAEERISA